MTLKPIIVDKPFDDDNGDNRIVFGATNRKIYGTSEVTYKGTNAAGEHVYWPKGYSEDATPTPTPAPTPTPTPTPEPAPAPTPTPSGAWTVTPDGEAFIRVGDTVFGGNVYGSLGTVNTAPAEFRTTGEAYGRKGFFTRGVDVIIPGVPVDAHTLSYTAGGKRYVFANLFSNLSGKGVKGTWTADGTWTAQMGCLRVVRKFTPSEGGMIVTQTMTNTCDLPLTDVRVAIIQDADAGDSNNEAATTLNRIVGTASLTATLNNGLVYSLSTDDARFSPTIQPTLLNGKYVFNQPDALTARKIGYSVKSGDNLILFGKLGTLAPGASDTVVYEMKVA